MTGYEILEFLVKSGNFIAVRELLIAKVKPSLNGLSVFSIKSESSYSPTSNPGHDIKLHPH